MNAQSFSKEQTEQVHEQCQSLISQYVDYLALLGDENEAFNDRKYSYTDSFVKLFVSPQAYVFNDLDPSGETSESTQVKQYADNILTWYAKSGTSVMIEQDEFIFGNIQVHEIDYTIDIYIQKTLAGLYLSKTMHMQKYPLEIRIRFVKDGNYFSDFRIAGIEHKDVPEEVIIANVGNGQKTGSQTGQCADLLLDERDGHQYKTVQIGEQCWMAENLNIGVLIKAKYAQIDNMLIEKYCGKNKEVNCDLYGGIYQWEELMQYTFSEESQGLCPKGWHVPSKSEWIVLVDYLGGPDVAGSKLKSTDEAPMGRKNIGATNSSDFSAKAAYLCSINGACVRIDPCFWTSSAKDNKNAWAVTIHLMNTKIEYYSDWKIKNASVRCLKD
ncbi:MAG: hypothetical protein KQI35_14295 [Bacteroidetes bacterium]|nr:hypothetical protein [Bacteroidota bacterium]